ncbi:MAG: hypothetical protein K6A95_02470 [Bacteroidales bacterium]|nr:hypothetical protein [Bacteroidales bacterium]
MMDFRTFRTLFGSAGCVTKRDFDASGRHFDKNSLTRWCANGYLVKVRNGCYVFPEFLQNSDFQYFIANKMYGDSYVSMHSALIYHGYLPAPMQLQVSCVSRLKTNEFRCPIGFFDFHRMKEDLIFGFEKQGNPPFEFAMATPEKALLDLFYLFPEYYDTEEDMRKFALKESLVFEQWDALRMYDYLQLFGSRAVERRVSLFAKIYGI